MPFDRKIKQLCLWRNHLKSRSQSPKTISIMMMLTMMMLMMMMCQMTCPTHTIKHEYVDIFSSVLLPLSCLHSHHSLWNCKEKCCLLSWHDSTPKYLKKKVIPKHRSFFQRLEILTAIQMMIEADEDWFLWVHHKHNHVSAAQLVDRS